MAEPTPIPISEVEAEAERCRKILNDEPPDEFSDMLYAAYCTLLMVLGYGTELPSKQFRERAKPKKPTSLWPHQGS